MHSHTPGPWRVIPATETDSSFDTVEVAPDRFVTVEGRSADEANANARLISLAPDMRSSLGEVRMMLRLREFDFCRDEPWARRVVDLVERFGDA